MAAEWSLVEDSDEEEAMALGERIRELRKEHGWSQAELGVEGGHRLPAHQPL